MATSIPKLKLSYRTGSIFDDAPPGTLFIHSCNSHGTWGAGIAAQFRSRYPGAYKLYRTYCQDRAGKDLRGKSMFMIPVEGSGGGEDVDKEKHFVGCLFIRDTYGAPTAAEKAAGYQEIVLRNTARAVESLLLGIDVSIIEGEIAPDAIKEVRMPRINSGLFAVPWAETERVLNDLDALAYNRALRRIFVYGEGPRGGR